MIVPFFPPNAGGGVYRALGFVKYLARYGWSPTVVTAQAGSFWITDPSLLGDVPADVRVFRTSTLSGQSLLSKLRGSRGGASQVRSSGGFGALRRLGAAALIPDTYVGWYPFARREARRLLKEEAFDVVYSTSPPETAHLVGHSVSRAAGLPWVADFRDPWMNLHLLPPPTALHRRMHRRLERRVCNNAAIVVTNRWHKEKVMRDYPNVASVTIIRNGFDSEKVDAVHAEPASDGCLHITHAGMLTQKRSAGPFLEGLKMLLDERRDIRDRIAVTFAGPRESANDEHVAALGLSDVVRFRDTVPHAESLQMQKRSHILLLIKHLNPDYEGLIPGKLFEYIGARRPILALVPDGEVAEIIREHRRGEIARLDDIASIRNTLASMFDRFVQGTLDTGYDLSEVATLTREKQTGELAAYFDKVAR